MPTLYLVGTPIGNLEDISLRAIRILQEVSLIAAEDTRSSGRLLSHYQIKTPMVSYHEYSKAGRIADLLEKLEGADVALVSDAGMPGLSDPGYRLVRAAIKAGVAIVPIPGPSAAITALISSGLPTDSFLFLGFLPRQQKARRSALDGVATLPYTLVLYEAPHRVLALLSDIEEILGDRRLSIGRELTKLHEEIWRGRVREAIVHFSQGKVRGEFTIVIAASGAEQTRWHEAAIREALTTELSKGVGHKEAAITIARQSGWRKRDVYKLSLKLK